MKIRKNISKSNKSKKVTNLKRKISIYTNYFLRFLKYGSIIVLLFIITTNNKIGILDKLLTSTSEKMADFSFQLENVSIAGNKNTNEEDIIECLNADFGTPIFLIDLNEVRTKIIKMSWITNALVHRKLPDTVIIELIEKEPQAIWQKNKNLYVIDKFGSIIRDAQAENFPSLLHVIGEDANIYAPELVRQLNANLDLAQMIEHAIRFGRRRWDLNLTSDITVKMPQYNFNKAYAKLSQINKENKLFSNNVKTIDLRDPERIYIEYK